MTQIKFITISLAFMMVTFSGLAIFKNTHFLGIEGLALNWIVLGLGIALLMYQLGFMKLLKPPFLYIYIGAFALMFLKTMGIWF